MLAYGTAKLRECDSLRSGKQKVLCILTRKQVLGMPFAGRKSFFGPTITINPS